MSIRPSTKRVGINQYEPTQALHVVGNIYCTGTLTQGSDESIKEDIQDVCYTIQDIANAPAITFAYKDSGERSLGTIANY